MKKKLYICVAAQRLSHDDHKIYRGVVPMSEIHRDKFFEEVNDPRDADIIYLGQFSDGNRQFVRNDFPELDLQDKLFVADIEGDWHNKKIALDLIQNVYLTINNAKTEYAASGGRMFVRPTFSKLLHELATAQRTIEFKPNISKIFGFLGQLDPNGTRLRMAQACEVAKIKHDIVFNDQSYSQQGSGADKVEEYIARMKESTFALCPRGVGRDTIRFFEACAAGRIPVILSSIEIFRSNETDHFWFKMPHDASSAQIALFLREISDLPVADIEARQVAARQYFETLVKEYFQNPTKVFLNWLEKESPRGI